MDTDVLEDIGLTSRETKVYLSLLELGETAAGPLKRKTGLQNSVIHLCLGNLIQKGLVNYVEKGRRRFYTATNPVHLIDFIEEKKRRIQALVPLLLERQKGAANYEVHIYEGAKGIKAILEDILRDLKRGEEFLIIGAPKEAHDLLEPYFLDFHKRRVKLGITLRSIYKKEARPYAEVRKKMPFTHVRYLPEHLSSAVWITTYKDKSILLMAGDIILGIVIQNRTIADNFKEYFELIWKMCKE